MKEISLNGIWSYRVGNGKAKEVTVPFSHIPVGRSECTRCFDLSESADRVFLKFEGITYYAKVLLNGEEIGEMLPYCEYEFEITHLVKPLQNELCVILEDIDRAFGPSEGWENFGGIIRNVSLVLRESSYLKNVFFKPTLQKDLQSADIALEVDAEATESALLDVALFYRDELCLSYQCPLDRIPTVRLDGVQLWSPDTPNLYTLKVDLICTQHTSDSYQCSVGFRDLQTDRHRFLLNGKPLFLKGVCKHEMIGDSGHCPTAEQMEADMRMIKEMGCNFVRLVHYPHNKQILEIADRIGLMVSEEPGLWWSDTSNPEIAAGSLEVLRRTILRDRNHPAIAFWLCFNECMFTEQFLIDSAAVCRQYDPTRMTSGANCMSNEDTLLYYNRCGFDFYTMHPYSSTFDRARTSAKILHDKPLLFTEWGGYQVYNNPHLLSDFMSEMHALYLNNADDGALAGAFLWFFAELNDYNRGAPACEDGVLHEGVVERYRKPTMIFDAFCKGLRLFDEASIPSDNRFEIDAAPRLAQINSYRPWDCTEQGDLRLLLERAREDAEAKGCKRKRRIEVGPLLSNLSSLASIPLTVTPQKPLLFKGGVSAEEICIVGLTSLVNGYPLGGGYGEEVCKMTICYQNGRTQEISLQNGVHFTTAYKTNGSSMIDPIADSAERIAVFSQNKNFEIYVLNQLSIRTNSSDPIDRIEFSTCSEHYLPLFYGVFSK